LDGFFEKNHMENGFACQSNIRSPNILKLSCSKELFDFAGCLFYDTQNREKETKK